MIVTCHERLVQKLQWGIIFLSNIHNLQNFQPILKWNAFSFYPIFQKRCWNFSTYFILKPFMPGGNKKITHTWTSLQLKTAGLLTEVCVTFSLPPGIKGLNLWFDCACQWNITKCNCLMCFISVEKKIDYLN